MPTIDVSDPRGRVRDLATTASMIDIDNRIPPKRYFRSGLEMVRMANVYLDEGNLENAFVLYSKFITLFVEKLPQHPSYKECTPQDRAQNKKKLQEIFPKAEDVKLMLLEKYEEEKQRWEEKRIAMEAERKRKEEELARQRELENLKLDEERKKELERQKYQEEQEWQMILQREREKQAAEEAQADQSRSSSSEVSLTDIALVPQQVPSVPPRALKPDYQPPPPYDAQVTQDLPGVDRMTKPIHLTSPIEDGRYKQSLREVIVPARVMPMFTSLAEPNTRLDIETCGILAGKLSYGKFVITHLLIPNQRGTSDSCTTENEEDIFDFQDRHDLITLGWIHTHPSQTSFLSSIDLHTQCSYQLMLPEAVAIVCSPKHCQNGIYSLTLDYGLDYIAQCRVEGFHPHPNNPVLYGESDHAKVDNGSIVTLIDLRK